ncbi:alpha/beta hydrolase [Asticcacaulis sp. BYS171W]|uniref:Alpha/beta hydrolase n=1 Tax=Asticcacaulis aquaticus TaxID=2984212 RepID=A0ABT5HX02_9CAUL|nr:alpha/beta hydrolase [Asticcacaulis aquaticus]MDC7684616.1 alpha/beta hydrolase [Asticcacaulis aquaticus]
MSYKDVFYLSADKALTLYARDYNPSGGDPVLCLHGLTRNSADFQWLAAHLSTEHRVIVADQRGRGRSNWDSEKARYNLLVYAQDMVALLDHLNLPQVTIIGTSMGGLIAMLMAGWVPQRIKAIVLNDVGPKLSPEGLARIRGYVGKGKPITSWLEAAAATQTINAEAFPDYGADDWMAFARRTFTEIDGVPVPAYDPAIAEGMAPGSEAVAPPELWDLWGKLSAIPILAIRGGRSDLLSAETLQRMSDAHPNFTAVTIANRGHAPMLDEPEAVTAIDAFLTKP